MRNSNKSQKPNGINGTLYERPEHNLSFVPMLQPNFNGFYLDQTLVNNRPEYNPLTRKTTSTFGIDLEMKRQTGMYFYQYFIPVMAIVTISFFSFIIPLSTLPARVAIVVTQFLTLTNIFIHEMVSSYSYSSQRKCIPIIVQENIVFFISNKMSCQHSP